VNFLHLVGKEPKGEIDVETARKHCTM